MPGSERDHFAQDHDHGSRAQRIRELNDHLRTHLIGGRVMITSGVEALGLAAVTAILERLRRFDAFTSDNDPHGEHDFGAFTHGAERILWKIDYYDRDLVYGSPDPADP